MELQLQHQPGPLFEGNPVAEGTTRRGTATPVHRPQRPACSTHSSTWGLRPPEQLGRPAGNPHHNSRIPPQLEKNHVVPTSWQEEALAPYSVSREVSHSVLKCKTVLGTLDAWGFSPEARRGSQGASRAAPGKSGLHARGEGVRKGTPLASRVAQGVSGPSSSCVWNPRVFADDPLSQ